jgi:hypothetical protein
VTQRREKGDREIQRGYGDGIDLRISFLQKERKVRKEKAKN